MPHNWIFPFSFQFSSLDVSDSFEPLEDVVGHLVPAAAWCHRLGFPWAGGPGLIFIANLRHLHGFRHRMTLPTPHLLPCGWGLCFWEMKETAGDVEAVIEVGTLAIQQGCLVLLE